MMSSCATMKVQTGIANVPTNKSLDANPIINIFVAVLSLVFRAKAAITDPLPNKVKGIRNAKHNATVVETVDVAKSAGLSHISGYWLPFVNEDGNESFSELFCKLLGWVPNGDISCRRKKC